MEFHKLSPEEVTEKVTALVRKAIRRSIPDEVIKKQIKTELGYNRDPFVFSNKPPKPQTEKTIFKKVKRPSEYRTVLVMLDHPQKHIELLID